MSFWILKLHDRREVSFDTQKYRDTVETKDLSVLLQFMLESNLPWKDKLIIQREVK